ncbi:hypothetical protein KP509_11G073200 [Ceratopteris richardii]|uniref:Uncharacterized protein n=1 Tax=Ceratopteris richardii TaxID=49495 RepID=A0A8T2TR31_CERRI|nr:hypothetical protein KP509_11G073200 [Ceratopteris richardii]
MSIQESGSSRSSVSLVLENLHFCARDLVLRTEREASGQVREMVYHDIDLHMCVYVRMRERDREKDCASLLVMLSLGICIWIWFDMSMELKLRRFNATSACACVCVCVRERERERERVLFDAHEAHCFEWSKVHNLQTNQSVCYITHGGS